MLRKSVRTTGLFFLCASLLGCSARSCSKGRNDIPPEEQLHAYISTAVNVTKAESRQDLIDLTTGPLKAALLNASEETFKRAYIDKKYDFRQFEIIERKDAPGGKETQVDFKLVYKSWNAGEAPDRAPLLETKNRATLVYEHGQWAIARVESLTSTFEWEKGLPMDDVPTAGVDPNGPPVEIESSREVIQDQQKQQAEDQKQATDGANAK